MADSGVAIERLFALRFASVYDKMVCQIPHFQSLSIPKVKKKNHELP